MSRAKRYVYSVRRARINLTHAIQREIESSRGMLAPLPHSWAVAKREEAVRDLIASVRAEAHRRAIAFIARRASPRSAEP